MEKYKGYLVEGFSYQTEGRDWDGHSSRGNGEYKTHYAAQIVNPKTGKSINHFKTVAEAKKYVDDRLSPQGLKEATATKKNLKALDSRILKLKRQLEQVEQIRRAQYLDLPKEWY